jgi:hypothetical protein
MNWMVISAIYFFCLFAVASDIIMMERRVLLELYVKQQLVPNYYWMF